MGGGGGVGMTPKLPICFSISGFLCMLVPQEYFSKKKGTPDSQKTIPIVCFICVFGPQEHLSTKYILVRTYFPLTPLLLSLLLSFGDSSLCNVYWKAIRVQQASQVRLHKSTWPHPPDEIEESHSVDSGLLWWYDGIWKAFMGILNITRQTGCLPRDQNSRWDVHKHNIIHVMD